MQRILVIDDDPAVTSLLRRGLAYEGYAVSVAGSGEQGLALAREEPPDLIILDVMMPGIDGFAVLERLRSVEPAPPVLFLTARDAPADQVRGLNAGADDYIIKPFSFDVLLARVRVLLRRREGEQQPLLRCADLCMDTRSHSVTRGARHLMLTSMEFKILRTFLEHQRQVLSKDGLLDRIWGYDFGGNTNIVEVYVKQLRQKLEAEGEQRLLHTIRGVGYVLRPPEE